MAIILDGKACAAAVKAEIKEQLNVASDNFKHPPALGVVVVGDNPASAVYVRNKKKDCEEVGLGFVLKALPANSPIPIIKNAIHLLNEAKGVTGIILQLPVDGLTGNKLQAVIDEIDWKKDVDGLTTTSVAATHLGLPFRCNPCTPTGITWLLNYYHAPWEGTNAVVLGRSNIVGKPMADLLLQHDCNVTTLHSKTSEADRLFALSHADLIISATGQQGIIRGSDIKQGAIVVDVGIIRGADGKLHGDVDYESVYPKASFITPVPGGVGPMTRAMLVRNVVEAAFQYGW